MTTFLGDIKEAIFDINKAVQVSAKVGDLEHHNSTAWLAFAAIAPNSATNKIYSVFIRNSAAVGDLYVSFDGGVKKLTLTPGSAFSDNVDSIASFLVGSSILAGVTYECLLGVGT